MESALAAKGMTGVINKIISRCILLGFVNFFIQVCVIVLFDTVGAKRDFCWLVSVGVVKLLCTIFRPLLGRKLSNPLATLIPSALLHSFSMLAVAAVRAVNRHVVVSMCHPILIDMVGGGFRADW